jgi:hypothetical protein
LQAQVFDTQCDIQFDTLGFSMPVGFWKARGLHLFAAVWVVYSICPPFLSYDSYWSVATAVSLMERGSTRVDRFVAEAPRQADYGLECVPADAPAVARSPAQGCPRGHWYSNFPLGTAVLALPLLAAMKGALGLVGPLAPHAGLFARREVAAFFAGDLLGGRPLAELWCASTIGALTVWLQYRIGLIFFSRRGSTWYALLFAFGTTEWSLASRNLYPHGLTVLLLSGALYLLLRGEVSHQRGAENTEEAQRRTETGGGARYGWAGFLLALAFAVRPSNAISCAVLCLYVALHQRRHLARFVGCAAPVAVVFFGYQWIVRHSLLPLYLTAPKNHNGFWEGVAMNFFSPSRGLFIFTPLFLLAVAGMVLAWRQRWCSALPGYLAAVVALHALVVMTIWPGHCYGPRYFADITHLLMFFLIPAILWWRKRLPPTRTVWAAVFLILAGWGVLVHGHGATSIAANQWSALPENVDVARWRVWDWSDAQFLRGLR